ncbi:hypothetical protein K431DRAFT_282425 [Polychaeton citri CBS 116435]|uniref:Uncharacterized protein n=1 Tax=Polychaeton citri CBS 116435 TaxID=1314669 RepID=A0A9P4USY5_9PEZI|nr:hypothetical protein K431DRAFT_282425 [Polychaeton citri CBS 116435]
MAAASALPVIHAPFNPAEYSRQRSKQHQQQQQQQQPFDASLLCQKLEAHKREQDAVRRRRQQQRQAQQPQQQSQSKSRSAAHFVPKSAAAQFAATTTPLKTDAAATQRSLRRAASKEKRLLRDNQPVLVTNQMIVTDDSKATGREALAETTINIPSHKASSQLFSSSYPPQQEQDVNATGNNKVQRSSSTNQQRSGYMPGDAARRNHVNPNGAILNGPGNRQSCIANATSYRAPPHRNPRDAPAKDPWSALLANPAATAAAAVVERHGTSTPNSRSSTDQVRPRLSHDRPNWCQESQSGEDAKHMLQISGLMHRKAKEVVASAFPGEREVAPKRNGSGGDGVSETLINDAVRIIKKEEKDKRRVSIMGMFKRA